jgi:hypothetical protein
LGSWYDYLKPLADGRRIVKVEHITVSVHKDRKLCLHIQFSDHKGNIKTMDKDAADLKITLDKECNAYRWITEDEIKDYDFIPDIGGEIREVFKIRHEEIERIIMGW